MANEFDNFIIQNGYSLFYCYSLSSIDKNFSQSSPLNYHLPDKNSQTKSLVEIKVNIENANSKIAEFQNLPQSESQ